MTCKGNHEQLISSYATKNLAISKLDRQLRSSLTQLEREYQRIDLAIRNVVSLTEAFQMEQAANLQNGPLAGIRRQYLETRKQPQETHQPPPSVSVGEPLASPIEISTSEDLGPWSRKILLSLDGGGTRNFSTILILKALMAEIAFQEQKAWPQASSSASPLPLEPQIIEQQRQEQQEQQWQLQPTAEDKKKEGLKLSCYLPCHYFDFTIGTSFGGLIAIMLGRLRMNVEQTLEDFETLLDNVWGHPRIFSNFSFGASTSWPRAKYAPETLWRAFGDIVRRRSPEGRDAMTFRQQNEDTCRCIVTSFVRDNAGFEGLDLFRSYNHLVDPTRPQVLQRNPDHPKHYTILEVVRATTAAPTFFPPMRLNEGTKTYDFLDGGLGANNPILEGYTAVKDASGTKPQLSISIGSGLGSKTRKIGKGRTGYLKYGRFVQKWTLDAEKTHREMMGLREGEELMYSARLNVEEGIGDMKLDEWKGKHGRDTLRLIREKTEDYLRLDDVKANIAETARRLVEIRRARASDPDSDHWERFCHGVEYVCTVIGCNDSNRMHKERRDLGRHLEDVHHIGSRKMETVLDEGKRFPLYTGNTGVE